MSKVEEWLCQTAQCHEEDEIANFAMKILREKFDKTYFFCIDCDGLVSTKANCCLNFKINKEDKNINW